MIIADIAVVPLRPYKGEEQMYKVVDECIEMIQKAHKLPFELGCERVITTVRIDEKFGGLTIDDKIKNHRQV